MENNKELIPSTGMSSILDKNRFSENIELLDVMEKYQKLVTDILKEKGVSDDQIVYIHNNFIFPNTLDLISSDKFFNIEISDKFVVKHIGKRIRSIRRSKDMTQEDLVRSSGFYTDKTNRKIMISRIERGAIKTLTLGRIIDIAKGLGVTVEYLINGD